MATFLGKLKATTDSCIVKESFGAWDLRTDTGPGRVGYTNNDNLKYGCGMRFINITIPKGSAIISAVLEFEAGSTESATAVNTYFTGEKIADAPTFSTLANYQTRRGTVVGGATDDNITSARVAWDNIEAMVDGTNYQSPEIKTVIQEIVDLAGWASGNALAIFWDDHEGRSTASANTLRKLEWGSSGYYALIITWGPKLPSSDVVRVTGIRRIYRAGIYRMQLSLGEISDMDDIAGVRDYERFRHWWSFDFEPTPPSSPSYPYPGDDPERQWRFPRSPILPPDEPTMPPPENIPRTGRGAVPYAGDDPERQPLWKPRQKLPFPAPPPSFAPKTILEAPRVFKETVIDPIIDFVRSFFAKDF